MGLLWTNHEMYNSTLAIFPVHILPNNRWAISAFLTQDCVSIFLLRKDEPERDAMFTLGLALLTWSTIYGLENFDVWDGSELSCIAVANIAAGKSKICSVSDSGDHIRCLTSARAHCSCMKEIILAKWASSHEMANLWDLNPDVMWCAGVIDCVVTVNVIIPPPPLRCVSVGSRLEQQFRAIRTEMSGFHAKLTNVDDTSNSDFFRLLLYHSRPPWIVHLLLRLLLLVLLLFHNHTRCHHHPVHHRYPCGHIQVWAITIIYRFGLNNRFLQIWSGEGSRRCHETIHEVSPDISQNVVMISSSGATASTATVSTTPWWGRLGTPLSHISTAAELSPCQTGMSTRRSSPMYI